MSKSIVVIIVLLLLVAGLFLYLGATGWNITGSVVRDTTQSKTLTPSQENCQYIEVPYEAIETFTEQEPYQATEEYNKYLNATFTSFNKWEDFNFGKGYIAKARVKLKNLDNEGGWFTVEFTWKTLNDQEVNHDVRHYIEPDEVIEFEDEYDIESGEDFKVFYSYQSDPIKKTKTVTKFKDVQRTRTVTKYRQEYKCE